MAYRSSRLPSRFPVGTKYVIEGRPGDEGQMQVYSRYVEFPDGRLFRLPARPGKRKAPSAGRHRRRARVRRH
jgi:hypothetical protein